MARGPRASPVIQLPKVEFEKVEDDNSPRPYGVHDMQARSYGYNDFREFQKPDHYIRHIEPLESDLARQVEYDMDEQDQEWLDAVNSDRKKDQLGSVSYEVFEIIMDRLEKEWFDLTKNIPKPDLAMPSEDSTCAICDDSEGENSNAIVFCDGCNLAVHQDCYGVPYIPEGQWLCRKCTVSPENPVQCILCPNEGGAFKQTVHGEWVHLLCAIWIPETRVANEVFMEPITGVDKISKQRWKLKCNICDIREGACIQCAKTSCFLAFHATCARREKLLLPMKSTQGSEPVTLTCFCERHLPKEQQDARMAALAAEESHDRNTTSPHDKLSSSKSARAYAKTYKPGPPLVPMLIVSRILIYIGKVSIRKKQEFVQMMCRYWSLKREARRGAPLLKRLHLEPWTASAGGKLQSKEEKIMKLEQLQRLREDLMKVRILAELCRKRESRKLKQTSIIHNVLSEALFSHEKDLRAAFDDISFIDKKEYFKNPVSKNDVPDYFEIVRKPMCWSTIETKLNMHQYWDVQAFCDDINLVINNAVIYNRPGTPFYKTAVRIGAASKAILDNLNSLRIPADQVPHTFDETDVDVDSMDVDSPSEERPLAPIGDLEPPLDILDLLMSTDAIKDDLPIELEHDPLVSLFSYKFPRMKPPPPPPPPRAPKPKKPKPKRDRKAEAERLRAKRQAVSTTSASVVELEGDADEDEERQRQLPAELDNSPGFRAPRTRQAAAAAAAFEGGSESNPPSTPQDEGSSASISSTRRLKKRPPVSSTSQPPVMNDVDPKDSFSLFNHGWILPPQQKRGGRMGKERQQLPPPRKRQRTEPGPSRLSIASTAASENLTLRTSSQPPDSAPMSDDVFTHKSEDVKRDDMEHLRQDERAEEMEDRLEEGKKAENIRQKAGEHSVSVQHTAEAGEEMEVDVDTTNDAPPIVEKSEVADIRPATVGDVPSRAQRVVAEEEPSDIVKRVETPGGTIIIEKLDTPAIRRQRNLRRRALKQGAGTSEVAIPTDASAPVSKSEDAAKPPGSSAEKPSQSGENGSELNSLSEGSGIAMKIVGSSYNAELRSIKKPPSQTSNTAEDLNISERGLIPENAILEAGTLVWAKYNKYPWYPAVIVDDDDPMVPLHVGKLLNTKREKSKAHLHLVRFYDKGQSWQFITLDKMRQLGEDKILDEDMIALKSQMQTWKNMKKHEDCVESFGKAVADMEKPGDEQDEEEDDAEEEGEEEDGEEAEGDEG